MRMVSLPVKSKWLSSSMTFYDLIFSYTLSIGRISPVPSPLLTRIRAALQGQDGACFFLPRSGTVYPPQRWYRPSRRLTGRVQLGVGTPPRGMQLRTRPPHSRTRRAMGSLLAIPRSKRSRSQSSAGYSRRPYQAGRCTTQEARPRHAEECLRSGQRRCVPLPQYGRITPKGGGVPARGRKYCHPGAWRSESQLWRHDITRSTWLHMSLNGFPRVKSSFKMEKYVHARYVF